MVHAIHKYLLANKAYEVEVEKIHFFLISNRFFKLLALKMYLVRQLLAVTFKTESSSVSNNTKFEIFQKSFQNGQLFSIKPIKYLNAYADS